MQPRRGNSFQHSIYELRVYISRVIAGYSVGFEGAVIRAIRLFLSSRSSAAVARGEAVTASHS